jgi:hypothetical protein
VTAVRSNPPLMHFSRNPSGPKTSRMEGLGGLSAAGPSDASSGPVPLAVGSSSIGTYSRSISFAARRMPAPEAVPELAARFAKNPPSLLPDSTTRLVTITYPLARFLTDPRLPIVCIPHVLQHLALEHPASVLPQPSFLTMRYIQCWDFKRFSCPGKPNAI